MAPCLLLLNKRTC
jgi:hypothetical protein